MTRKGFALLTVLWVMVAASAISLAGAVIAREAVGTARNRMDAARAEWLANACVQRALASVDAALVDAQARAASLVIWRALDLNVALSTQPGCDLRLESSGVRLDVNGATAGMLTDLFHRLGSLDGENLARRVIDVRADAGRIWDVRTLSPIVGASGVAVLDTVMGGDSARLSVNQAPLTALAVVPGFTDELVERIRAEREAGNTIADLRALAATASPSAAESLMVHAPDVERLVTTLPEFWVIRARGWAGSPPFVQTIDARIVLAGAGVAVTRWTSRP